MEYRSESKVEKDISTFVVFLKEK